MMTTSQNSTPVAALSERLQRIGNLPKPLQDYLWSGQVEKTFLSVMSKQQVSDEKTRSAASLLVGKVLIGELHPNSFIKALAEDGGVPLEKARGIARDVSAQVFAPVRNELMAVYKIGSEASADSGPAIPAVPQQTSPAPSTNLPPSVPATSRPPATIVVQPPPRPTAISAPVPAAPKPLMPPPAVQQTTGPSAPARLAPAMRESSGDNVPHAQPSAPTTTRPGNPLGQASIPAARSSAPTVASVASDYARAAAQANPSAGSRPPMSVPAQEPTTPGGPVLSPQELLATEEVTDLSQGGKKGRGLFGRLKKSATPAASQIVLPKTTMSHPAISGQLPPAPPPRITPPAVPSPASGNTINLKPPGQA